MFGRKLDQYVLFVLSAFLFYIFFLNAWRNIPLACLFAFICCVLSRHLFFRRHGRFKLSRAQAEAEIMRIACLDDDEGKSAVERLIRYKHAKEDFEISAVIKHPSGMFSESDVFSIWKKHRGMEKLVIAVTCPASPRAIMYAREFAAPRLRILDKRVLIHIIRESGLWAPVPPQTPFARRLRQIPRRIFLRPLGLKHALWAIMLLVFYLTLGKPLYLFLGLFMLFMLGISLLEKRERKRLF